MSVGSSATTETESLRAGHASISARVSSGLSGFSLVPSYLGTAAWIYGLTRIHPTNIGSGGLLAGGNIFFALSFVGVLVGFLMELSRAVERPWRLGAHLVLLIVVIHSAVPIIFRAPEYSWVYKHVGIISAFQLHGRVTIPTNIYQEWPAFFAAIAALSSLAHLNAVSFAAWAPLAFELMDALLLVALFRLLTTNTRVVWFGILLYEGLVSWVGQDYLSPQAFGYTLWLSTLFITLRWLRDATPSSRPTGRLGRARAWLVRDLQAPPPTTAAMRRVALILVLVMYFVIVAAHQLTPYMALLGIGALTVLDIVRPRWLLLAMAAVAGGYLALHYSLISQQYGGLFSGGSPLANASGVRGIHTNGTEVTTAKIVRGLAAVMWLATVAAVARRRRSLGRVAILGALAFTPFGVLGAQNYGGEAIYRVFLFSSPWCALLIAEMLLEVRLSLRWLAVGLSSGVALFAGLQGLYAPVLSDAFTTNELDASLWLYSHIPPHSAIILPVDNFPALESGNFYHYSLQVMPADPQEGEAWLTESNALEVKNWIADLGRRNAYVVVSRSMNAWADYYGAPRGYERFARRVPRALGWSVVYHNSDATIYRVGSGRPTD